MNYWKELSRRLYGKILTLLFREMGLEGLLLLFAFEILKDFKRNISTKGNFKATASLCLSLSLPSNILGISGCCIQLCILGGHMNSWWWSCDLQTSVPSETQCRITHGKKSGKEEVCAYCTIWIDKQMSDENNDWNCKGLILIRQCHICGYWADGVVRGRVSVLRVTLNE